MDKSQIQLNIKTKLKNTETIRKAIYRAIDNLKNYRTTYGFTISKPKIYNHSKTLKQISVYFNTPLFRVNLRESFQNQTEKKEKAFTEMAIIFDNFIKNLNLTLSTTKSWVKVDEW